MSAVDRRGRPLAENTRKLWRAIAGAGRVGTGSSALYDKFRGVIDTDVISSALQGMLKTGYIEREGVNRYGVWRLTEACKTPIGETRPVWLGEPTTDGDHDDGPESSTAIKYTRRVEVTLPAAPESIFTLAQKPAFSLDRLQAPPSAETLERSAQVRRDHREFEKATAGHAVLDWHAPLLPKVADDAEVAETLVGGFAPAERERRFVCSIDSDGELYVCCDGAELMLDVERTRKLLHYLDHLRAADLVASIAGAAS